MPDYHSDQKRSTKGQAIAKSMLANGMTTDLASLYTGLTEEQIAALLG